MATCAGDFLRVSGRIFHVKKIENSNTQPKGMKVYLPRISLTVGKTRLTTKVTIQDYRMKDQRGYSFDIM